MRVLTWNLHGLPGLRGRRARLAAAARAIVEAAPSVVLLQEIWLQSDAGAMAEALAASGYRAIHTPRRWRFRSGGLLSFVQSRHPAWCHEPVTITSERFVPFGASAPMWRVWEADGLMQKGFLEATLTCGPVRLAAVNTHLQAEYTADITRKRHTDIRRAQLGELLRGVTQLQPQDVTIIAGDFNTAPEEPALSIVAAAGWRELTAELRRSCGGGTNVPEPGHRAEWLDYVFAWVPTGSSVSAAAHLISNTARDVPYSDHHGVVVDITLI